MEGTSLDLIGNHKDVSGTVLNPATSGKRAGLLARFSHSRKPWSAFIGLDLKAFYLLLRALVAKALVTEGASQLPGYIRLMLNRRHFLETAALIGAASGLGAKAAFADRAKVELGEPTPFSFDELIAEAKALAESDYQEPEIRHPDILQTIDYDAFQQIVFKRELGLGEGTNVNFPVQLFHLGRYFRLRLLVTRR